MAMLGIKRLGLTVALVAVASISGTARAGGMTPDDQLKWDAAQALYGVGLTIAKTKTGVSIAPAQNGLTQEKYNQYVTMYLEAAKTMSAMRRGTNFKWESDYSDPKFDPRAEVKLASLLLEPAFKYGMCRAIIGRISDSSSAAGWDRGAFCVQHAMIDATTNTCIYRGEKSDCSSAEDRGELAIEDAIFVADASGNYPILVTVSGGRDFINNSTVTIAGRMLDDLISVAKLTPKIQADWKARLKKYHASVKVAEKKQRKLANNKIAFSDTPFTPWAVIKPAKEVSCKTINTILYAPSKSLANDYYYVDSIDGVNCDEHPIGAGETARSNIYLTESCRNLMEKGGETHKVEVSLHVMQIGATSTTKEIKNGRVKDVQHDWGKAGKKLFSGSVVCTM